MQRSGWTSAPTSARVDSAIPVHHDAVSCVAPPSGLSTVSMEANALARTAGGDAGVAGTVANMNALARHLGALDTHAVTPSGLDGEGQYTSVYDLALIARVGRARITTLRASVVVSSAN